MAYILLIKKKFLFREMIFSNFEFTPGSFARSKKILIAFSFWAASLT